MLSFVFVGIYWNNHHHLFQARERVNGAHALGEPAPLFWLSLVPFGTAWMGESHFAPLPTAVYGVVLLMAASPTTSWCARSSPTTARIRARGRSAAISRESCLAYSTVALPMAFFAPLLADAIYVLVALIWLRAGRAHRARPVQGLTRVRGGG